jgi:hypothetical protein
MPSPDRLAPLVVSMREAEHLLSCSRNILYKLLRAGELQSYVERQRRKITTKSINALIERRLTAANGGEFQFSAKKAPDPSTRKRKAA